jgi:hypothetical protein
MKNKLCKIAVLAMLVISSSAHAEDYYKEVKKNFSVNNNVRFDVDVSFADLNIQTWDQAQMEIIVKMDVVAKNEERANEMFESISVNISEGSDLVGLVVSGGNWNCNSNGKNSESYQIHIEVKMPLNAILDGKCSFGDVQISDMKGACELNIEYGNFRANGLWSYENDVRNAFGDAKINGTNGGEFRNEYGQLEIGKLQGNAEIHSSFGDMEIDRVTKECKNLELKVEYADADVNIAGDAGFRVEANSSYGDIDMPDAFKKTSSESDYTSKEVKGTIGNGEGRLEVDCDFGDVEINVIVG